MTIECVIRGHFVGRLADEEVRGDQAIKRIQRTSGNTGPTKMSIKFPTYIADDDAIVGEDDCDEQVHIHEPESVEIPVPKMELDAARHMLDSANVI